MERSQCSRTLLEVGDLQLVFFALFATKFHRFEQVRLVGRGQFVSDVVAEDLAVPVLTRRRLPRDFERVLIHKFHFDVARSTARSLFGRDDRHRFRWLGCPNVVLSNETEVVVGGRHQIVHSGDGLLSWNEHSVDVRLPVAFADFVFDQVASQWRVSVIRSRPRQLNGSAGFVQNFDSKRNFRGFCKFQN